MTEQAERRRDLGVTFGVALAARLAVVGIAWDRFPPADDGVYYDTLARRLAHGLGYTWAWPDGAVTPVAHYPVGYPALLALAYRLMGESPASALVMHAFIGAIGATCVHVVAEVGASRRAARCAGLAVALHPALLSYTPAVMTEGVTSALVAMPFALAVLVRRQTTMARCGSLGILAGLTLGGVVLVRPQSLLLVPVVAWVASQSLGRLRSTVVVALVGVGALLAVVPWTLRNERALGRAVMVSANGGWNLLIGTDPAAKGGWRALEVPEECRTVWEEAEKDACFGAVARRRIAANSWAWLMLVPSKLATTFDLGGSGPSYLSRSRPDLVPRWLVLGVGGAETVFERVALGAGLLGMGWAEGSRRRMRQVAGGVGSVFLLTPYAWVGYVALVGTIGLLGRKTLEREPLLGIAGGVLAATVVTHAVFFGAGRYGLVVYPWVAALAAGVAVWEIVRLSERRMNF